jgi:transposase-like protein
LRKACGALGSWNQIGGENQIVECDETHVFRKYNRGRLLAGEDRWIFGAFCRDTGETFFLSVPDRRKETLWPLMASRIREGSIVITDSAAFYHGVKEVGFTSHFTINHSSTNGNRFVRQVLVPRLGKVIDVHTNNIEVQWKLLKARIDSFHNDDIVEGYIEKAQYFRNFLDKLPREARFGQFLKDLARVLPGPPASSNVDPDQTVIYFSDSDFE